MFFDVALVIDGHTEEEQRFTSESDRDDWVTERREEYARIGGESRWHIYSVTHDHVPGIDCHCLDDHSRKPDYTIGE